MSRREFLKGFIAVGATVLPIGSVRSSVDGKLMPVASSEPFWRAVANTNLGEVGLLGVGEPVLRLGDNDIVFNLSASEEVTIEYIKVFARGFEKPKVFYGAPLFPVRLGRGDSLKLTHTLKVEWPPGSDA